MNKRGIKNSKRERIRYCKFTFYGLFAAPLIFVLVLVPVAPLFASEEIVEEATTIEELAVTDSVDEPQEEDVPEEVSEEATEEESISDNSEITTEEDITDELVVEKESSAEDQETNTDENSETNTENTKTTEDVEELTSEETEDTPDSDQEKEEVGDTDTSTTTDPIENESEQEKDGETPTTEDTSTTTDGVVEETENDTTEEESSAEETKSEETNDEEINTEPETVDEVTEEETVTEEENVAVPEPQIFESVVFNDENKYQFSKDQCVSMGDGSFYCMEVDTSEKELQADGVYAALDKEGDKEIFIKHGGEAIQITENDIDDDSPYFDEVSNTVVWHGLVDGRQQIFEYDIEEEEATQLTEERYNNMHPTRHDDVTVWQGWVGNDWEIMLQIKDEFVMVTDNDYHDISPSINGNHIIWQAFENELWRVKIYDVTTGVTETISDSEGGSVENPRFVLVYDTKFDNGDVETKGYDLKSGESVPLSATPTQLPPELPDPEPTEEERALVAPTVQIKKEDGTTEDDIGTNDIPDTDTGTPTDDIIVAPYVDDIATSTEIEMPIVDVIVTPFVEEIEETTATSTEIEEIDDVVIEPVTEVEDLELEEEA